MNVILEKNGQQIEYKAGSAYYLLLSFIPVVGGLLSLVLTIMRKQFRGIILNQVIIIFILMLISQVIVAINSPILAAIYIICVLILNVAIYLTYILKANLFSVNQRLEEGYTVVNMSNPDVQAFVTKAQTVKKPFWQITRF